MALTNQGAAGVTAQEIDLSGPVTREPVGVPAGVIGTAVRGPAFVPITVGVDGDFYAKFGNTDGEKFGPLAAIEWLRNAGALTYIRVLGVGDGQRRSTDGSTAGAVTSAGFVVGEDEPRANLDYALGGNEYANSGTNSVPGRLYVLGCLMSESAGSTLFSDAGLQVAGSSTAVPIVRGVLMIPSGVITRLSASTGDSSAPASTLIATDSTANGGLTGSVVLLDNNVAKQEFVMLLNGHQGLDSMYPNVITASFDMTAPNYFGNVFNTDPLRMQQAGHYLYSQWDIYPVNATITGSGLISIDSGSAAVLASYVGAEPSAFLLTGSRPRNEGTAYVPNYENWEDRFSYARSPWVVSQRFGGEYINLFRIHALDAGSDISEMYKLSIENIASSTDLANRYGKFDLLVRAWDDTDVSPVTLEEFRGLSLDPSDDNYIAKRIGDINPFFDFDRNESEQRLVIDGQYESKSNLIRVEVSNDVDNQTVNATALPLGVRGPAHLVTSGSMPMAHEADFDYVLKTVVPPIPMRKEVTQGSGVKKLVNSLLYWGPQFEHVTSLSTPNASVKANESLNAIARFYPNFMTNTQNVVAGDNAGTVDTDELGIIDSDRFCNNLFTLENIQVVTSSAATADPEQWVNATYVRNGVITANESNKTRRITTSDFTQANRRFLKYSFFMQGGFDGVNVFDDDEAKINNAAVRADMNTTNRGRNEGASVATYLKAITVMKNVVNTDIQLLAIPGIRESLVSNTAIDAVEERFDAMYIMDIEETDVDGNIVVAEAQQPSVANTVTEFVNRDLDSSFGAAYFPDQLYEDPNTRTNLFVPPSVLVLGAMALNDAVGHPWFAPAGFTRGALTSLEPKVRLNSDNMDDLYNAKINPLVAFPGNATSGTNPKGGVVVWGQRTLQQAASALDRVNVRRLLIDVRRQVREIARTIIFEPNREATLAKFSAAVTPRLQRVQALSGVERFRVMIDSSTTTQEDVENNTLRGKIFIQPTKSIEFVSLDFVVSNNLSEASA